MSSLFKTSLITAAVALGTLGASIGANAADLHVRVQQSQVQPVRADRWDGDGWNNAYDRRDHRDDRDGRRWQRDRDGYQAQNCAAPQWNGNTRYFPGQAVWRNGHLYVATDASRGVYNVNSPPEWTPNYWQPARCADGHARWERRY